MNRLHLVGLLFMSPLQTSPNGGGFPGPGKPVVFAVRFNHIVGGQPLQTGGKVYYNDFGEPFTVQKFRYYIHQLSYTDSKGNTYTAPEAYYLVDEADSASKQLLLPATAGAISSLHFIIGVDSIDNVSGAQAAALDPARGMFWAWNSGYIFAKLEGRSDSSHAPGHYYSFHVGGYKTADNALREVNLPLNGAWRTGASITISADILKWFHAMHSIRISQAPVCHQPGAPARQLADNYSTMFGITVTP